MADSHWRRPRWTSWAPPALPNASNCPSQHARPPQISRNECARPNWQNSMAMNWPQLVKPRACRSALCSLTAFSNSPRENSLNTCEKMLHTFIRLSLLRLNWFLSGTQSSVSGTQPLTNKRLPPLRPAVSLLIWTAMVTSHNVSRLVLHADDGGSIDCGYGLDGGPFITQSEDAEGSVADELCARPVVEALDGFDDFGLFALAEAVKEGEPDETLANRFGDRTLARTPAEAQPHVGEVQGHIVKRRKYALAL